MRRRSGQTTRTGECGPTGGRHGAEPGALSRSASGRGARRRQPIPPQREAATMQVAGIREVGARVELIDVSEPRSLAPDEVLVEVVTAGVGNWDEFVRTGGWDVGGVPPIALGVAAAGRGLAGGGGGRGGAPGGEGLAQPPPPRRHGNRGP